MTSSTIYVGLVGAVLAGGCGDGGTSEALCEVPLLEPCPGCGSGEVLRAAQGEHTFAARPLGGYVGLGCGDTLLWHDGDFTIAHRVTLAMPGDEWSADSAIVGNDDVVFFTVHRDSAYELGAVRPDGSEVWRVPVPFDVLAVGPPRLTMSGDAIYFTAQKEISTDDLGHPFTIAGFARGDGSLNWTWSSARRDVGDPNRVEGLTFFPGDGGSGTLYATLTGEWDLGEAGILTSTDGSSAAVAVDISGEGVPVSARIVAELPGARVTWWALARDGGLALAGDYTDTLDLGSGVVLSAEGAHRDYYGKTPFIARLAPDTTAEWAINLVAHDFTAQGLAVVGDAVLISGHFYRTSGGRNAISDAFATLVRDGAVSWRIDVAGRHLEFASAPQATADGTALVRFLVEPDSAEPSQPALDVGRIHLDGATSVVVELAP